MSDLTVLRSYLSGKNDYKNTRSHLNNSTAQGQIWAGEIALERAHKYNDLEFLSDAQLSFDRALGSLAVTGKSPELLARAKIRHSHLPVDGIMIMDGALPPKFLAETVYRQTVQIAHDLVLEKQEMRREQSEKDTCDIKGVLGELAVLSLLERVAIREIGSDNWFPELSLISQDRNNKHGSSVDRGWDINIFSDYWGVKMPSHKIQVKNSRHAHISVERRKDIILVETDPDIRINSIEKNISENIIRESYLELFYPRSTKVATPNLDIRKERLLDIID
jgi:hypothetical protein